MWEFPHVELLLNVYLQYALADCWVHIKCKQRCSHHQPFARVGKGENLFVRCSATIARTLQCKLTTWPCLLAGPNIHSSYQPFQKLLFSRLLLLRRMEKSRLLHWGMIQEFHMMDLMLLLPHQKMMTLLKLLYSQRVIQR